MSLPTQPITVKLAEDSRCARGPMSVIVTRPPASVVCQAIESIGAGGSQPTFQFTNASRATGISRRMVLRSAGTAVFTLPTGTGVSGVIGAGTAFRSYPLQSSMQAINLTLDDVSFSITNPQQTVPLLSLIGNSSASLALEQSATPIAPDLYATVGPAAAGGAFDGSSTGNLYGPVVGGRQVGITKITGNNPGGGAASTVTITFDVHEPLMVGPCVYAGADDRHIFGVNRVNLNCSFTADAWFMFASLDPMMAAATSSTLTFSRHRLLYDEVNISDAAVLEVPRPWSYPYTLPAAYYTSVGQVAVGAVSASIEMQAIQVGVVPSRLVFAVVPKIAARSAPLGTSASVGAMLGISNICMPIQSISIRVGGRPGSLENATPLQLYEKSLAAGVQLPWQAWSGASQLAPTGLTTVLPGVGGPLVVNFEDLSLPKDVYPGSNVSTQITARITYSNVTGQAIECDLVVIALTDGLFTCLDGVTAVTIGIPQKALEDAKVTHNPADLMAVARSRVDGGVTGGSSFSDAMSGIARGFAMPFRALGQVAPLAAAMAAPILGPGALPIGAALHGLLGSGAAVIGGGRKKKGGAALHLA